MKVVQIRAELQQRGQDSKGLRSALVERLVATLQQQQALTAAAPAAPAAPKTKTKSKSKSKPKPKPNGLYRRKRLVADRE